MKQGASLGKLLEKASLLMPQLSGAVQGGTCFSHGPRAGAAVVNQATGVFMYMGSL